MNLSSIHNAGFRFPIYNRAVPRFSKLETLQWLNHKDKSLISAALYQKRGGLYNYHKVHPIEYIAVVDKPRYSLFDVLKNKIKI